MSNLPAFPSGQEPKGFWERKEGVTGMVVIALAVGAGLFFLNPILAFMVGVFASTVKMVVMGTFLFGFFAALANGGVRRLVSYGFRSVMRGITGIFVTIDPIGILKSYREDLIRNHEVMSESLGTLRGQMRKLSEDIKQNQRQRADALQVAREAQRQGKRPIFQLKARAAGRLEKSNMTLQELFGKMELVYRVLSKMYEVCGVLIEDLGSEIDVKTRERNAIRAAHSAMRSAQRIISGGKDERMLFDEAMEYLANDYAAKVGEIEHFVEMSQGFISTVDLQNGVFEREALEMLERWEKEGDSILLGTDKQLLIAAAGDDSDVLNLEVIPEREGVPARTRGGDSAPRSGDFGGLYGGRK